MGTFRMKIKETKAGPARWDPQGFEQSYGRMEKPTGLFLVVKVSAIPSQPLQLDILPRNIWARESIPALISAKRVTSSSQALGKRKAAVTQRSRSGANPRDGVLSPCDSSPREQQQPASRSTWWLCPRCSQR